MAFGRPPTIHDSFMRVTLPVSYSDLIESPHEDAAVLAKSAEYFASTMWVTHSCPRIKAKPQ